MINLGDDDENEDENGNDHLLPDLGEGIENGGQVGVMGRVQVPSNMVHHLKSDFWKSNKEFDSCSSSPWRCSHSRREIFEDSSILPYQLCLQCCLSDNVKLFVSP